MIIKAALFDLDGTLADSLCDLSGGVNTVLRKNGYPIHETAEYRYFVGDGIAKMVERALPEQQRDSATVQQCTAQFLDYYRIHFADDTTAYAGMQELLQGLKKQNIYLAVVTNKAQEMAERLVQKLYGNIFDGIYGLSAGRLPKPNPQTAAAALAAQNILPQNTLFIGDSGTDIKTAAALGAVPVGVLWGYRTRQELLQAGAAYLVREPAEIGKLITI